MLLKTKLNTAYRLGAYNILRVMKYRIGLKTGLHPVTRLSYQLPKGNFFSNSDLSLVSYESGSEPVSNMPKAFGHLPYEFKANFPNWFYNPLTHKEFLDTNTVWYKISDFDNEVGDIKGIWEASRFDWLLRFAEYYLAHEDEVILNSLDAWINNWCLNNPAYLGPNWKCGQEASIRVLHIVVSLIMLNKVEALNNNIIKLIESHLYRIAPTISYAVAQDNNHGTSEASALYIGGAILYKATSKRQHLKWQLLGRKWLINRADKLIMNDGGFSQYSVNYHRLMLDCFSLSEVIRLRLDLKKLPTPTYSKLSKATNWLYVLVQDNGDVPNLGANDGANLFTVGNTDYRDYRPSLQLASTLFCSNSYLKKNGSYDYILKVLNINKITSAKKLPSKSKIFERFGLITAQRGNFFISFKFPKYKFRPGQSDALHLDVWLKGVNILRDGGSYSYNTTPGNHIYFSGPRSHNTVEFDDHSQMPRISRFLQGAWLKPKRLKYKKYHFQCGYKDYWKCYHLRKIELKNNRVKVVDRISGFKKHAILRWRLHPSNWKLTNNCISNGTVTLEVNCNEPFEILLTEGWESQYYFKKTKIPVLEVKVTDYANITTTIKELT